MSDLGQLAYFLGIEFKKTNNGIFMHQSKYTTDVLKRFHMIDCNSVSTPMKAWNIANQAEEDKQVDKTLFRQIISSLRYICNTRSDIAYGVGLVSRFMKAPKQTYLIAVKRVMRYLKGAIDFGITFPTKQNNKNNMELVGFSDADWCGDKMDRKSKLIIYSAVVMHQ
ncbi:PREDICTED: uncharacterized protein LOC109363600 [Lupinus angustifolius]|uniref:uncharacterized protein LOC109363600 n=1 Tax=Lupinus angustifolius TaxID=3871 RepID=UPI00092E6CE2|nr:PREDICTED: uncharacterized protein LOC109363600 [Lupinus angustifolius]